AELVHELLGKVSLAGADDLTELDVRGPQPLEGVAQPPRQAGPARGAALAPVQQVPATQRATDENAGAQNACARWDATAPNESRHLGAGPLPELVDAASPFQRVDVDLPRRIVAEGANFEVGGGHGANATGRAFEGPQR